MLLGWLTLGGSLPALAAAYPESGRKPQNLDATAQYLDSAYYAATGDPPAVNVPACVLAAHAQLTAGNRYLGVYWLIEADVYDNETGEPLATLWGTDQSYPDGTSFSPMIVGNIRLADRHGIAIHWTGDLLDSSSAEPAGWPLDYWQVLNAPDAGTCPDADFPAVTAAAPVAPPWEPYAQGGAWLALVALGCWRFGEGFRLGRSLMKGR
jgi:hypothetical protein